MKANLGKKNAFQKMMKLMDETEFVGLRKAEEEIDWSSTSIVTL